MWNGNYGGYPNPQGPPPPAGFDFPSPQNGNYPPPSGPPGGYQPSYSPGPGGFAPPSGPPPPGYGGPQGFPSPQGPPPVIPPRSPGGGYPGERAHHSHHHSHHPPSGPPPGPPPSQGYYAPPPGPPHMPPQNMQHYGPQFQGPNNQPQQPFFQYSQCNGKKKALCIGINYIGQKGELRGCHNDAQSVSEFLIRTYNYNPDDIVVLTDGHMNPRQNPTRDNILQAMNWLVRDARPNDSLFFHYSGHGGQTKDLDGDEADGYDEVIYPVDYERNGHIVDDDMHMIMVKPLPPGCRLTAIFDSCHSGSALDLPYIYSTEGKIKEPNLALEAGQGLMSAATSYMKGDMGGVMTGVSSLFKTATGNSKKAEEYARATRTSPADVISFSGCKDSQTSADTTEAGRATGAMSYALIHALRSNSQPSYQQLLNSLRDILRSKYSQKPQLSSSHPMDTSIIFIA